MSKFEYVFKRTVNAVQWNQINLDDLKELLSDIVESNEWDGVQVYAEYMEDFFLKSLNKTIGGYYTAKFYAWGDDQEVDPGMWVVVYDDGDGEIMSDPDFTKRYEKVNNGNS